MTVVVKAAAGRIRPVVNLVLAVLVWAVLAQVGSAQPGILRSATVVSSGGAAFFTGATEIVPAGAVLGFDERFAVIDFTSNPSPLHDIHFFDEDLNQVGTIQVALAGPHCTGLAWDETAQTFWVADFLGFPFPSFVEFDTAGFATGNSFSFCDVFPAGGATIDTRFGRRVLYALETGSDTVRAWDIDADAELTEWTTGSCGSSCPVIETPDGPDSESFGLSLAADPSRCGGGNLVIASGASSITSALQFGWSGDPTTCPTQVDSCFNSDLGVLAAAGEFVPQGIVEFESTQGTGRDLFVVGAGTGRVFILDSAAGIGDCQNVDPDAATLYVNTDQGGPDFTIEIDPTQPLAASIQRPGGAGNGRFVIHLDAGYPDDSTISSLFDLGDSCFPFVGGAWEAVWNNAGRNGLVGSSNYFGDPIPDPARADTFFLLLPSGDPTNLPLGSRFTLQGAILNPNSSSGRGASLTNAIRLLVE